MKKITFNKVEDGNKCLVCGKNKVRRWNDTCQDCKKNNRIKKTGAAIGKRMPAAVIKTDDGREIFVDKFGKEVKEHNYDLKNDPRGYKATGRGKKTTTII